MLPRAIHIRTSIERFWDPAERRLVDLMSRSRKYSTHRLDAWQTPRWSSRTQCPGRIDLNLAQSAPPVGDRARRDRVRPPENPTKGAGRRLRRIIGGGLDRSLRASSEQAIALILPFSRN
jgi:hypothetical protein